MLCFLATLLPFWGYKLNAFVEVADKSKKNILVYP